MRAGCFLTEKALGGFLFHAEKKVRNEKVHDYLPKPLIYQLTKPFNQKFAEKYECILGLSDQREQCIKEMAWKEALINDQLLILSMFIKQERFDVLVSLIS